jgi:DNA-binding transcriptional LysR family regulator
MNSMAKTLSSEARLERQLKLHDLKILSSVAQWGSMAKAATHLSMSQPAVSAAIANLESMLAVRLLDRSPRGAEPTIYARALLKRGVVVFDELQQALRDIEYLSDPTTGEIRIGCPESLGAGPIPAIIDRFSRQNPQVSFQVLEANTITLEFRELRERNVDVMFGRVSNCVEDEDVNIEILFDDKLFVVAGADSPWARRRKVALADLVDEPWILAAPNNVVRLLLVEAFHARGLNGPKVKVSSNSMHVRMHLLTTGRYLTVLAGSLLRHNADRWSLKALPIDFGTLPVAVATLRNRTLSPAVQLFIECSRQVMKSMSR